LVSVEGFHFVVNLLNLLFFLNISWLKMKFHKVKHIPAWILSCLRISAFYFGQKSKFEPENLLMKERVVVVPLKFVHSWLSQYQSRTERFLMCLNDFVLQNRLKV